MLFIDDILSALKDHYNQWLSEDTLCQMLYITREDISSLIELIRSQGCPVYYSPDKGYLFSGVFDHLSPEAVVPNLQTRVFGKSYYFYYPEIDSTNIRALELANAGYPEGTIVAAESQTAGRGRRGRSWFSPPGQGIYVSIILRPVVPMSILPRISLIHAVAVAETLIEELGLPARIKWPNDVLIDQKKICGILSEAVASPKGSVHIVTGIGLNIHHSLHEFPVDLRTSPTSIFAEMNQPMSRVNILQKLLLNLELRYYELQHGHFSDTLARNKELSVVLGQNIQFDTNEGLITGNVIDIDENGSLLAIDQKGTVHSISSGEIEIIRM